MKSSASKNYRSKNAFSLIELSIVILIIGILVAGVTSSSRLIKRMKITVAQNLTQSSPVPSIKDLAVWYETSLDKSFNDAEESDGTPITTWFDNNIQSSFKIDFKQATLANQPKYSEGIINSLPSIRFDGVDDFLLASSTGIAGKGLTVFLVGQRVAWNGSWNGIIGALGPGQIDDTGNGTGLSIFFDNGSSITSVATPMYANAQFMSSITHPGNGSPYIFENVFSGTTDLIYVNGVASASYTINSSFLFDSIRVGCAYYNNPFRFYNGYISEIIIYSRGLNTEERKAVEAYLSKKYSIKIV
jgi:prepilin-type N-terminal cleavage/methylation domain-containing protein